MAVGLDVTQAVKTRGRGIARYISEVAPRLIQPEHRLNVTFCVRGERWWVRHRFAEIIAAPRRSWLPLAGLMSTSRLALFHSFGNHLPAWSRVPTSFTVHDFRSLDQPGGKDRSARRLQRNIRRASGIICLTQHGRTRLEQHFPDLGRCHVAVIPHGVNHRMFFPRERKALLSALAPIGLDRPYILQLGSWFQHKNPELTVRAFADSRARKEEHLLVFLGGGVDRRRMSQLYALCDAQGVTDCVRWIEDVPAPEVPLIVAGASAVVMPSLYEGFGLPLLEAMASGVPGIISDSSCLPEVAGGAWPMFSQGDVTDYAKKLDLVVFDAHVRREAIENGLRHARGFCWNRTASETARFFRDTLKKLG